MNPDAPIVFDRKKVLATVKRRSEQPYWVELMDLIEAESAGKVQAQTELAELRDRLTAAEAERDEAVELLREWLPPQPADIHATRWTRTMALLARLRDRST